MTWRYSYIADNTTGTETVTIPMVGDFSVTSDMTTRMEITIANKLRAKHLRSLIRLLMMDGNWLSYSRPVSALSSSNASMTSTSIYTENVIDEIIKAGTGIKDKPINIDLHIHLEPEDVARLVKLLRIGKMEERLLE